MSSYRKPSGRPPKPTSPVDQEKTRVRRHHASGHAVGRRNRPILTLGIVLATVIVAEIVYYVGYQNTRNSGRRSGWRRSSSGSTRGTRRGRRPSWSCSWSASTARRRLPRLGLPLPRSAPGRGARSGGRNLGAARTGDGQPAGLLQAAGLPTTISEDADNLDTAEGCTCARPTSPVWASGETCPGRGGPHPLGIGQGRGRHGAVRPTLEPNGRYPIWTEAWWRCVGPKRT